MNKCILIHLCAPSLPLTRVMPCSTCYWLLLQEGFFFLFFFKVINDTHAHTYTHLTQLPPWQIFLFLKMVSLYVLDFPLPTMSVALILACPVQTGVGYIINGVTSCSSFCLQWKKRKKNAHMSVDVAENRWKRAFQVQPVILFLQFALLNDMICQFILYRVWYELICINLNGHDI